MSEQEQLDIAFENVFEATPAAETLEEDATPDVSEQAEVPDVADVPEETPPAQTYRVGDRDFTEEDLLPVVRFSDWISSNPEGWKQLTDWEEGRSVISPAAVEEPATDEVTYNPDDDIYSEEYLRGLKKDLTTLRQEQEQRLAAESGAAVDDGVATFSSKHTDLSEDDMNTILKHVVDREALAGISEHLPYGQKMQAVAQRLEEAYRVVFFERSKAEGGKELATDLAKRRRASSSSSSVSAPRVAPEPSNATERRQALVDEFAQALSEGT